MIAMKRIAIVATVMSLAVSGTAREQHVDVSGDWVVTSETNPMDSVKTVAALKDSVEHPAAALVIRCRGKHAEVYVKAPEVVSEEYGVRIKFDEGKAAKQRWERATSYDALFSPAPVDLLRSVRAAKTFYFEYTPYQRAARVVSFDVTNLPASMAAACVTEEIEKADASAKKAADERIRLLAQQKQRLAALRTRCASFADESFERVERSQSPLPPEECWDVLEWMRSSVTYEDLVKRRELCKLPSFANDPNYCGAQPASSVTNTDNASAEQRLIIQCMGDSLATSVLKDNCSHKWFSDSHPDACQWAGSQTGK